MLIGTYYHTLEANGRVSVPKTFRDQNTDWVVTRGLDGGLFLFRAADFATRLRELSERTLTKKVHRDFIRLLANEAHSVQVDANGRVQLPEYLIEFAHLTKQIVLVGSLEWVEIWDMDTYHTYRDQLETDAIAVSEQIEIQVPIKLETNHD